MTVAALAGGRVDLHNLTQVLDPNPAANEDLGAEFNADGAGSVIDLSTLATFQDNGTFPLRPRVWRRPTAAPSTTPRC